MTNPFTVKGRNPPPTTERPKPPPAPPNESFSAVIADIRSSIVDMDTRRAELEFALMSLIDAKMYKDLNGKDVVYYAKQDAAWNLAFKAMGVERPAKQT